MFGDIIQPTHLLFILVVALIVLGPKRLPEVGRSLGRGLRDFRSAMSGVQDEAHQMFNMDPEPTVTAMSETEPALDAEPAELPEAPASVPTAEFEPEPVTTVMHEPKSGERAR